MAYKADQELSEHASWCFLVYFPIAALLVVEIWKSHN